MSDIEVDSFFYTANLINFADIIEYTSDIRAVHVVNDAEKHVITLKSV